MNNPKYASQLVNESYTKKFWFFIAVTMIISNLMMSYFVITADTSETVIVVPEKFERKFTVKGDFASAEYVAQMAESHSQSLLTYSPDNVSYQYNEVLKSVAPEVYPYLKNKMSLDVETIKRKSISSVFYKLKSHADGNNVVVTGELKLFIGEIVVSSKIKSFRFNYRFNHKLYLNSYSEVIVDGENIIEVQKEKPFNIENLNRGSDED